MKREKSIFDLKPHLRKNLRAKIEEDGSNLTNISAFLYWFDLKRGMVGTRDNMEDDHMEHIFTTDPKIIEQFKEIEYVNIHIDPIAAEVLPIMVLGRLMKDCAFTFESPKCINDKMKQTVYFVPYTFNGPGNVLVSEKTPMMGEGGFLQIFCSKELIEEMAEKFLVVEQFRHLNIDKEIRFSTIPLMITIHPHHLRVVEQHNLDKALSQKTTNEKESKVETALETE